MVTAVIQDGSDGGEFRNDVDATAAAAALVDTWDALFLQAMLYVPASCSSSSVFALILFAISGANNSGVKLILSAVSSRPLAKVVMSFRLWI